MGIGESGPLEMAIARCHINPQKLAAKYSEQALFDASALVVVAPEVGSTTTGSSSDILPYYYPV